MTRAIALLLALLATPLAAQERAIVVSRVIDDVAVSIYRDPDRSGETPINPIFPNGFALISETRTIDLPAGPSTIRFEGVSSGMVAVSAIVTGLPGGIVEKNRDAQILSPGSLLDGTLGNRVTLQRTNPATGAVTREDALVRTRADGGLVLQTRDGFEAVRCAGLPETLVFDRVPAGLSASPVLSIDTQAPEATRVAVTLTYLSTGFDWQADYVARLADDGESMDVLAWITLVNANGESFADAQVNALAGTLNVTSDYRGLAAPPQAPPLRLTCYPLGSTAAGSPIPFYDQGFGPPPPPPPPPPSAMSPIIVTAQRRREEVRDMAIAVAAVADLEALGDLKLYRLPFRTTVASNGVKQVALLVKDDVTVRQVHVGSARSCDAQPAKLAIELRMTNEEAGGLGVPLPQGAMTVYARASNGEELLVGQADLRDYAVGQDVELAIATSPQVFIVCQDGDTSRKGWTPHSATITNANPWPVDVEIALANPAWETIRRADVRTVVRNGWTVWQATLPPNGSRAIRFETRDANYREE